MTQIEDYINKTNGNCCREKTLNEMIIELDIDNDIKKRLLVLDKKLEISEKAIRTRDEQLHECYEEIVWLKNSIIELAKHNAKLAGKIVRLKSSGVDEHDT